MTHGLRELATAVAKSPARSPASAGFGEYMKVFGATFQAQETVDSNLSQIKIGSQNFRFVPRLAGAWTTTPSAGTTLLVGKVGNNLIILGVQLGNTGLATH